MKTGSILPQSNDAESSKVTNLILPIMTHMRLPIRNGFPPRTTLLQRTQPDLFGFPPPFPP